MDESVPKYYRLIDHLKKLIREGNILPGQQLPTEMELSRRFAMSRHTVRKAFNELEHEGWIIRQQGRGTFCRDRDVAETRNVAVLTTYISEYIFPSIFRGIEKILSSTGYTIILANTWNDREKEARCMENLAKHDLSGLIIEPTKSALGEVNRDFFRELKSTGVPSLFVHAAYPEIDSPSIVIDDEAGGYQATQYLLQLGHRRIAGIFKSDDLQGVRRREGYKRALDEYGCTIDPAIVGAYDTEQMVSYPYQFTIDLLRRNPRPTAIVAYNDEIALHAMDAIRDEGLDIPGDISIVGYDDSHLAVASEVKLTTIRHPKEDMGERVGRSMVGMIEGNVENPSYVYQPELVVRSSCGAVS